MSVTFGGAAGNITASSSTSITVTTPSAPKLGAVNVVVTNSAGVATSTNGFRYDLGYPGSIIATAAGTTSVTVSWSAVPGAGGYQVVRSADHITFTPVGTTTSATMLADSTAAANTAYLYEVRASAGMSFGPYSAPDLATTVVFTDDPLITGVTTVKADHVTQLRTAVNAVRVLAGIGAFAFADPTVTPAVTPVRTIHLTELRARLDEARSTLGLPALSYTDGAPSGVIVKAVHFAELRSGTQ
jgi:hypothetical protein